MVTSDEERQRDEAQEPAPPAAPVSASERPVEAHVEVVAEDGVDEAVLLGGLAVTEAAVMNGETASPLDSEINDVGATSADPTSRASAVASDAEAPEPVIPAPAPPLPASDPASGVDLSEDEATGRRVEALLAETPDAHPEGPQPTRGEVGSFSPQAPLQFDDPEGPAPPPSSSAFRDSVLKRNGMDRMGPIVAFDFDGTLTVRDSFTAFLKWREGSARYHAEMAALAPAALKYLFDRDPGKLKAAAVRRFLQGLPRSVLNEEAMEFAALSAPLLFRPDALKAWRRYRQDGARLVIVTASPENIVAPFARGLGADLLIATQLIFDEEDRVQGGLLGDNCRGPEKVRRIKRAMGEDVGLAAAYGDTDGDWEMLEMAEQQFMRLFVGIPGKPAGPG